MGLAHVGGCGFCIIGNMQMHKLKYVHHGKVL